MLLACLLLPFALAQTAPAQPAPAQAAPAAAPAAPAPQAPPVPVNPRILGRDDLDFARKLHEANFDDLARRVCAAVEAAAKAGGSPFTPDDALEATILGFEAETGEAVSLTNMKSRADRLQDILARAEVFSKTLPDGPKFDRLNQAMASAQQGYAEALLSIMQDETDPKAKGLLGKRADEIYTQAEEGLAKRVEAGKASRSSAQTDPELDAIDKKLIIDQYGLARMYYLHSLLLTGNEVKKRVVLHQALDALADFELDWSSELMAYDAYIYDGLCHKELGEDDKAVESFDYAIGLRETFGTPQANGTYPVSPEAADTISLAVQQKMLFLRDRKDYAGAIAVALDFLKTIPDALRTQYGMAVLAGLGDAQLATADGVGATETANKMLAVDPKGPWSGKANQLMADAASKAGSPAATDPATQLHIAETYSDKRDYKSAHAACRQAREIAAGSPKEADIGAESYVIDGIAYGRENRKAEACVAFDSAFTLYPKGVKAPDAMWRSINGYMDLYDDERRAFYKNATDELMARFVKDYANDPNVPRVAFIRGQQLETEGQFDEASKIYLGVPKTSVAYGEAQFRAGNCLMKQAKYLESQNKLADADAARKKAKPILENAQQMLEKQMGETLADAEHQRLAGLAFGARVALAQALLAGSAEDAAKVQPLLKDVEDTFPGDANKIATAWSLRIKALEKQGKLQDAVTQLDGLVAKTPDAPAVGSAAASLARALDQSAEDKVKGGADPASRPIDSLRHDAARLYVLSVRGQISGKETLNAAALEPVGMRLFALALIFENAPAGSDSFLSWEPQHLSEGNLWDQIADIFETITNASPNYHSYLFLGRVRGLQAHWKEAATAYSKLFAMEALVAPGTDKRFDAGKRREHPDLVPAYVEWGLAEAKAGNEGHEKDRLSRAADIFDRSLGANNLEAGSELWWRAKIWQIQTMVWRGQYDAADIALRDLERTTQDYDGNKYGAKTKLLVLKAEVDKKK